MQTPVRPQINQEGKSSTQVSLRPGERELIVGDRAGRGSRSLRLREGGEVKDMQGREGERVDRPRLGLVGVRRERGRAERQRLAEGPGRARAKTLRWNSSQSVACWPGAGGTNATTLLTLGANLNASSSVSRRRSRRRLVDGRPLLIEQSGPSRSGCSWRCCWHRSFRFRRWRCG